jgi:hypothetical protein
MALFFQQRTNNARKFSHTVRNYVPSSISIPTATPSHVSCPDSVVGSFMSSTLLSASPPLPAHSSSYGGGNKHRRVVGVRVQLAGIMIGG